MADDVREALHQAALQAPHPGPRLSRWLAATPGYIAPRRDAHIPPRTLTAIAACVLFAASFLVAGRELPFGQPSRHDDTRVATAAPVRSALAPVVSVASTDTACLAGEQKYQSDHNGYHLCYPSGWVLTDRSGQMATPDGGSVVALSRPIGIPGHELDHAGAAVLVTTSYQSLASAQQELAGSGPRPGSYFGSFGSADQSLPSLQARQLVISGLPALEFTVRDTDTNSRLRVVLLSHGDRVVKVEETSVDVSDLDFNEILRTLSFPGTYNVDPQFKVARELTDPQMRDRI
jgi:hypothetical protein